MDDPASGSEDRSEQSGDAAGSGSRLRRIVRSRLLWAGLVAVALIAAAALYYDHLAAQPQERADAYSEAAADGAAEVDAAMNRTYLSFDAFIDASFVPKGTFKDVDDVDELKRKLLPIYRRQTKALRDGRKRIKKAMKTIKQDRSEVTEGPETVPLVDNAPVEAADEIAADADEQLDGYRAYLKSYGQFIDYELEATGLSRRLIEARAGNQPPDNATLGQVRDSLQDLKNELSKVRRGYKRLDAHVDAERLNEIDEEALAVYVDYLGAVKDAFDALDIVAFENADAEFIDETRRLGRRAEAEFRRFARSSRLQKGSRKLTKQANQLELRIAELDSGDPEEPKEWQRPELPAAPGGGSGGGDGDKRLTSAST